jgi:hypothetical protein
MKRKIIAISSIIIFCCSLIFFSSFSPEITSKKNTLKAPLTTIYVYVSQQPDICGVQSPCSAYVRVLQGTTDIVTPQLYSGPGTYTFSAQVSGTINAKVTNTYGYGGCTCVLNSTNPSQSGPPYSTFNVSIW